MFGKPGTAALRLSAAMGMAMARDFKGEDRTASLPLSATERLTGGMAFEALNHIGHEQKKLMVILNDNEMSIAPNVGAMHNYLSKIVQTSITARSRKKSNSC